MLYPSYAKAGGGVSSASTITGGPIFRLKFVNLIQDVSAGVSEGNAATAETAGLVGTISGFTYEPDFDAGFFDAGIGTLFPQTINLAMEYTVNHTHQLGWKKDGEASVNREENFPYNTAQAAEAASSAGGGGSAEAEAGGIEVTGPSGSTP